MTEHAIDEWTNNAIPPGSGRYYSILHADAESQPRLRAVTALISIWSNLCFNSRETEVAKKKLAWWREELQRDTYRHPVTVALNQALRANPAGLATLQQLLEGYGELLQYGSPSTEQANALFHQNTGGKACLALHDIGASETQPTCHDYHRVLENTGVSLSKFRCLRYLHQHTSNGLLCLSLPHLESHNISPPMLSANSESVQLVNDYVVQQLKVLDTEFNQHLNALAKTAATARPLYVYLHLQRKLLNVVLQDGGQVLQQETRLTPIKNFFYALSAARKFNRATGR